MNSPQGEIDKHLRRIARGTLVTLLGWMILQPLGLLFAVALVRVLGEKGFGVLSLGMSVLMTSAIVMAVGLPQAIIRFVPLCHARGRDDQAGSVAVRSLLVSVSVATAAASVLTLGAGWVAGRIFHKPELAEVLQILAWAIPLEVARVGLGAVTVARHTTIYDAGSNVTRLAVGLVVAIVLAWVLDLGVAGAAFGVLVGEACAVIVALTGVAVMFPEVLARPLRLARVPFSFKELFSFSFPLVLARIAQLGLYEINTLLSGLWLTSVQVGIYTAASRLARFGTVGLVSVGSIMRPTISALHGRGKMRELDWVFQVSTRWVYMLTMPLLVFIILRARELLALFGPSFPEGTAALVVLCIGQVVNVSTGVVGHMLNMTGWQVLQLVNNVVLMMANLGLCVVLIPRYGLLGAAAGGAIATAGVNLIRTAQLWYLFRITPYRPIVLKAGLAAWLAGAVLLMHWPTVAADLVGGLVVYLVAYVAMLLAVGTIPEDRLLLQAALSPRRFRVEADEAELPPK